MIKLQTSRSSENIGMGTWDQVKGKIQTQMAYLRKVKANKY